MITFPNFIVLQYHNMKNETTPTKSTWETPDLIVLPINDVTLGAGAAGIDFGSEISA
jgi:hypothetical protein